MPNVMLDLETYGNSGGCAILSIGAVFFEEDSLGDEFYQVINLQSCYAAGLRADADTVAWWKNQTPEARQVIAEADHPESTPLITTLAAFTFWLNQRALRSDIKMWGNGSDFDNVILTEAYKAIKSPTPWSFYNNRCYRTLKNLAPLIKLERSGTHHNALDDAKTQASHAVQLLNELTPGWYAR